MTEVELNERGKVEHGMTRKRRGRRRNAKQRVLGVLIRLSPLGLAGGAWIILNFIFDRTTLGLSGPEQIAISVLVPALVLGWALAGLLWLRTREESSDLLDTMLGDERPLGLIRDECSETLRVELEQRVIHGQKTGWGHNLHRAGQSGDKPTSALASAYGLKACRLLGDPISLERQEEVANWILSNQSAQALWAARTQTSASAEVSAIIVSALATSVGIMATSAAITSIESSLVELRDDVGQSRVFPVSAVISGLLKVNSGSTAIPGLLVELSSGARRLEGGHVAWGKTLTQGEKDVSAAHTARAVTALHRAKRANLLTIPQSQLLQSALDYLGDLDVGSLHLDEERIERADENQNPSVLVVRHFTPALVLRALAESGHSKSKYEALGKAVMARYDRGAFWWNQAEAPIWMMYQGISALQASVLARGIV